MNNPFPCQRYRPMPLSRRDMLRRSASGFGAMALAALGPVSYTHLTLPTIYSV